ncbi:hypothetical protein HC752_14105 [Vibrio sp. S9_S30]|uniref:hypothetical protein n=1 Tax=Vibrio sp. S9_S30 TaxID=2720226 RepID=UPI00168005CD|nr:hypothetical protein [Vibrio sp. S9_S30]MBD1558069.1 hypothetical protein [Vibrio sp. S9_S30]
MKKLAFLISSTLLVTACGGGDDGVSSTSDNSKTKITTNSITKMSNSINAIDFNTVLSVANDVLNNSHQSASPTTSDLSKTTACFNHSGEVVLTTNGNEMANNGTLSINSCSLSYDLNIKVNGKLDYSKAGSAYSLTGFFSIRDENRAEELVSFKNIDLKYAAPSLTFHSIISADGETHGITIKHSTDSDNVMSTTSIKVDGAEGTWFQIDQTTSSDRLSCKLTQSSNLSFSSSDACSTF